MINVEIVSNVFYLPIICREKYLKERKREGERERRIFIYISNSNKRIIDKVSGNF